MNSDTAKPFVSVPSETMPELEQVMDTLIRDFTAIGPRPKSEARRRFAEFAAYTRRQTLQEVIDLIRLRASEERMREYDALRKLADELESKLKG